MNKEELNKKIDIAVMKEEEAVPIYTEHISTTIFWAGLSKESVQKIKGYLKILRNESLGHVQAFKRVKKLID